MSGNHFISKNVILVGPKGITNQQTKKGTETYNQKISEPDITRKKREYRVSRTS